MSTESEAALPLHTLFAALERVSGDENDIIELMLLARFADGSRPYLKEENIAVAFPDASPIPPDGVHLRTAVLEWSTSVLFEGTGWTAIWRRWSSGNARAVVVASTEATAADVLAGIVKATKDESQPSETQVPIGFWYDTDCGPNRELRTIDAPSWTEIADNYSVPSRAALDRLMAMPAPDGIGRLLLFNGPPGTGKTTALRALARAWRAWCQVDYVTDPESLFRDPGYLMRAAMGEETGDGPRWRLLLLEDCDELIRAEAKSQSGQALSRLLNLTDGLLGQGRDILVAITTNEELATLHPAVVRPGRCLAQIAVGPLSAAEADAWRSRRGLAAGGASATLAELIAEAAAARG